MFSIEVVSQNLRWIAAIYKNRTEGEKYLENLKSLGHAVEELEMPHLHSFPVYAIERMSEGSPQNCFEHLSEPEYLQLIEHQQKNRSQKDDFEAYFTVYHFSTAHFQEPYENSLMGALDHIHVDDYYLDNELARLSLSESYIERMASDYNIAALFNLFEDLKNSSDKETKSNLAEGLLSLFANMDYDHACGKLTTDGINYLLPILEKAKILSNEPLLTYFSRAYLILLQEAINNQEPEETILLYMEKAIEVNESVIHSDDEELQEAYHNLAMAFELILEHKPSAYYLEQAYHNIQKSIAMDTNNGDWQLYLRLIFIPISATAPNDQKAISTLQLSEKSNFQQFAEEKFMQNNNISMTICQSIHQLKEHLKWHKLPEALFPEDLYSPWIERALDWEINSSGRIEVNENAHFLHNEGIRLERIDLLNKAAYLYQRLIDAVESPAFEVYYLAKNAEAISDIYLKQGELNKGYLYRNKATEIYETHIDTVMNNYSTHAHYTEFLFSNYFFDEPIHKPSIEELEKHAVLCEHEGNGHYSKPTSLRIKLALHENKEEKAIFLMSRLLILLELLYDEVNDLLDTTDASKHPSFYQLLLDTKALFQEISDHYYYHPKLRWDDVKDMSPDTIISTWENRKAELKEKFKA
ncbi:hypothetical protein [Fulvivirga sediminis]|uniref:Uncharacterized protein n=1 Tax=Fulvivirga sediminis TaxID=2803949 RepID=A0A937FCI9_9BACT|nr:hypothetical protein [Fulvivirga sediminis]MBL3658395.1 hypothetical protein [Fulvivirga sediminis]